MAEQAELLQTKVPGWNADMKAGIENYARTTYGATDQQMADAATSWWMVDALRKAQLYDKGAKTVQSKKVRKLPKTQLRPGARKSQTQVAANDLAEARARLSKSGKGEDFMAYIRAGAG